MNSHEGCVGFAWRCAGRRTGGWLCDIAIALTVVLLASMLGMATDARAMQRAIEIGGNHSTAMVSVPVGKSQDVRTNPGFTNINVADPDVADVNPLTDHSLSILAKKIGTTRVSVYDANKKLIGIFDVEVTYDVTRLTNELKRRFPRSHIWASAVNGRIMLSGEVADAVSLDQAVTIARQFGPDIINTVSVMSPQQVMLEVRFVELSRTAGRELGVQWNVFNRYATANIGSQQPASNLPLTAPANSSSLCSRRSCRRRAVRSLAVRFRDRTHPQRQHHDRRGAQCARAEGPGPQSGRAKSGRIVRRHRELPGRRRISDPRVRQLRPGDRRL